MTPTPIPVSPTYSESAALVGVSTDLSREISVRLARFPAAGAGTLWASAHLGGRSYAISDRITLSSPHVATPVNSESALYEERGVSHIRLDRHDLSAPQFGGTLTAAANMHRTGHPPAGAGEVPVGIEASFRAFHAPVLTSPGRHEVFGLVEAVVTTPEGVSRFTAPGKWHEQSGDRPSFAPPFTYIAVSDETRGLLAVSVEGEDDYGFLYDGAQVIRVIDVKVDPPGAERAFAVTLENGRRIAGRLKTAFETSVPIEGKRRPGSTVRAETDIGPLVGHANDWSG
ncbi:MAG: hypothetical protein HXY25_10565 [Alphaproteobacteria bacterium]|nr:hypothetical protein [Alphaproteobacteria bacterium]